MQWMEEELKQKKWPVYYLLNSSGKLLSDFLAKFPHTHKHTHMHAHGDGEQSGVLLSVCVCVRACLCAHTHTCTHTGSGEDIRVLPHHFPFLSFKIEHFIVPRPRLVASKPQQTTSLALTLLDIKVCTQPQLCLCSGLSISEEACNPGFSWKPYNALYPLSYIKRVPKTLNGSGDFSDRQGGFGEL